MNNLYYMLGKGVSLQTSEKNLFDSRSSERLSRDEVLVRPVADPNAVLMSAILRLQEDQRKQDAQNAL